MGFLSEIKKLFWAQKAVAKHGAEQAKDYVEEVGSTMVDKAGDLANKAKESGAAGLERVENTLKNTFHKVSEAAETLAEKAEEKLDPLADKAEVMWEKAKVKADQLEDEVKVKADAAWDKTKEVADKLSHKAEDAWEKTKDVAENVGETVSHQAEVAWDKTKEVAEDVGEVVLDKAEDAWEKTKDVAENLGEKLMGFGSKFMEKAEDLASKAKHAVDNPEETMDKLTEKAKKIDDKLKDAISGNAGDRFADTTIKESLDKSGDLSKHDDFFEKAKQFAEGNYSMKQDKLELKDLPDTLKEPEEGETPPPDKQA